MITHPGRWTRPGWVSSRAADATSIRESQPPDSEPMAEPDTTAVRTALWRALHVHADPPPHVLDDVVGLGIVGPEDDWRARPDMQEWTAPFRAAMVGRGRFVEDLVAARVADDVEQYVLLGAGLDTFAQRRTDLMARVHVYEIDQPDAQAWKREQLAGLAALGDTVPAGLHFVPVDFESGESWWDELSGAGFDATRPAVV